jgi:hypothetical protein
MIMTALDFYRSLRGSIVRATGKPGAYLCVLPGDTWAGADVRAVRARGEGRGRLLAIGRVVERLDPSYAIVQFADSLLHLDRTYLETA